MANARVAPWRKRRHQRPSPLGLLPATALSDQWGDSYARIRCPKGLTGLPSLPAAATTTTTTTATATATTTAAAAAAARVATDTEIERYDTL